MPLDTLILYGRKEVIYDLFRQKQSVKPSNVIVIFFIKNVPLQLFFWVQAEGGNYLELSYLLEKFNLERLKNAKSDKNSQSYICDSFFHWKFRGTFGVCNGWQLFGIYPVYLFGFRHDSCSWNF